MTEKQKQIIMKLAGDPELLKEFLEMTNAMGTTPVANEATMSLYVIKRHTEDGKEYYHPVVAPKTMDANPEDYTMIADKSMITLQNTYGMQVEMMSRMTGEKPIVITIPERTYNELHDKLVALVSAIYAKIDESIAALDGISALTGRAVNTGMIKGMMTAEIMGKMRVSGQCLNENMDIEDAHDYVEDHECECDCDDDCDCDCGCCDCGCDCCDDDCDNCDCDIPGECDECEGCDSYGECPCTRC
jgi:hypothetical protein